ncbi:unnamed protein product [Protopolystoma xenopodis]|uniref:Uncharacterized protein n=1 Tax=Protopolystoma xenopodis TaxID=117903 RepID=A0A448X2I4_9PLAT|nr:unnamed protein product [Protopolystoma xenopodis]
MVSCCPPSDDQLPATSSDLRCLRSDRTAPLKSKHRGFLRPHMGIRTLSTGPSASILASAATVCRTASIWSSCPGQL